LATITAQNDPNKTASTANVVPQQQVNPSSSGTPTGSGQFSTLQKYLGANKNAGQRVANLVGNNITNEATQLGDTTNRELSESAQANQNFGKLTDETKGFTGQLNQPAIGSNSVTGGGYDVNSYNTNLSGQKAAQDIANNQEQLGRFTGIRSGDFSAKQKMESDKQANEAVNSASRAYDTNKQRQTQLNTNQGRDQLLSNTLNTQNQRAGVRNLDNAFLTQDKAKTLNSITNNLRQNVGGLQDLRNTGNLAASEVGNLNTAQLGAEGGLNTRLSDMQNEYNDVLSNRVSSVNTAKDQRMAGYLDQFNRLQNNQDVSEGFARDLGLQNAMAADPNRASAGQVTNNMGMPGAVDNNMGMPNSMQGIRLFNNVKDTQLQNWLDTSTLTNRALSNQDVANEQDIGNLNNLAKLSGNTNNINRVSDFTGRQVKEKDLADVLNKRADEFQTKDLAKNFTGTGFEQEGVWRDSWSGKRRTGTATGNSSATANIDDFLGGNIYRNTSAEEARSNSFLDNILNNPLGVVQAPLTLIEQIMQPKGMESAGAPGIEAGNRIDTINSDLNKRRQALTAAGYSGGLDARDAGSRGEQERVYTRSEGKAVGAVADQARSYLDNIGYGNLVKIAKGDF